MDAKSLRLCRNATPEELMRLDGAPCDNYIGNDGKVYRTVKIGTKVWIADNLAETKYQNGDSIPVVTSNVEWVALTTDACCAYNNNPDNI